MRVVRDERSAEEDDNYVEYRSGEGEGEDEGEDGGLLNIVGKQV